MNYSIRHVSLIAINLERWFQPIVWMCECERVCTVALLMACEIYETVMKLN